SRTASLAAESTGGAVTLIFNSFPSTAPISLRPARGWTFTSRQTPSLRCWRQGSIGGWRRGRRRKVHVDRRAFEVVRSHEHLGLHAGQVRDESFRELFEPCVVMRCDFVEVTARQRNPLFRVDQVLLQACKRVIRF